MNSNVQGDFQICISVSLKSYDIYDIRKYQEVLKSQKNISLFPSLSAEMRILLIFAEDC